VTKETAQGEWPPRVWIAVAHFPSEVMGEENAGWYFQGTRWISHKPTNECDEEYLSKAEGDSLVEAARRDAYAGVLPRLRLWLEAYTTDLFTEEPPYTRPDSAAAAMGRHILGLLISEFEAAAQAAPKEGE
jgi:hypothetical protein